MLFPSPSRVLSPSRLSSSCVLPLSPSTNLRTGEWRRWLVEAGARAGDWRRARATGGGRARRLELGARLLEADARRLEAAARREAVAAQIEGDAGD